jgi:antitoxin YefM
MLQTTYAFARVNLASLCDEVTDNQEIVVIRRRNGKSVAMIDAAELRSLVESAHPMRSPNNAERLLAALGRSLKGQGEASNIDRLKAGLAE